MHTTSSNTNKLGVYALGSNSSGQLGVGHAEDVRSTPQRCIFAVEAEADGEGSADRGARGAGVSPARPPPLRRAHQDRDLDPSLVGHITKIVAGGNHTVVLTGRGRVFVAGRSGGGLRGDAGDNVFKEVTREVLEFCPRGVGGEGGVYDESITDVAASWDVSFAVVGGRAVVCWGEFGGTCGITAPTTSPTTTTLSTASATGTQQMWTSFVLDHTGSRVDVTITAIEAGMAHVVVLLSNGQVYGWGASRKGQLGEQYQGQKILRDARRIDVGPEGRRLLPFAPEKVILGREYTVFLRRDDKLVTWGSMAGNRDVDAECLFGQDDVAVSGWSSVHVLSRLGGSLSTLVKSMGKNNHGQFAPANLPPIRAIAAGSEHCVALTLEGQVIAWGWGEHGNCGEQVDGKGNVVDRWNVIRLPGLDQRTVVRDVAAGCATTFVICGEDDR